MLNSLISHVHFTSVHGIPLRYYHRGKGKNLILIHGLGANLDYWYKNIDFLAQHFAVLAIDLPGFGYSGKKNFTPSPEFYVNFFKEAMNHFGIKKANFVGHSMGGALTLHLALQHPELIEKLYLISNIGFAQQVALSFRLLTIPGLRTLLMNFSKKQFAHALRQHVYCEDSLSDTFVNAIYPMAADPESKKILLKILGDSVNLCGIKAKEIIPLETGAHKIQQIPLAILWGRNDPVLNHNVYLKASQHFLPNVPFTTIEQCGHMPQLEHPTDVNQLLVDFFGSGRI